MKCYHCGAATTVLATRSGTTRRRQCLEHPEHRFTTFEVVVAGDLDPVVIQNLVARIKKETYGFANIRPGGAGTNAG